MPLHWAAPHTDFSFRRHGERRWSCDPRLANSQLGASCHVTWHSSRCSPQDGAEHTVNRCYAGVCLHFAVCSSCPNPSSLLRLTVNWRELWPQPPRRYSVTIWRGNAFRRNTCTRVTVWRPFILVTSCTVALLKVKLYSTEQKHGVRW